MRVINPNLSPVICPFISACIAYYMVGLHSAFTHFLLFIAFSEVLTCAIIGIGLAVGAATSDSNMASMIGPIILMPMNIFGAHLKAKTRDTN